MAVFILAVIVNSYTTGQVGVGGCVCGCVLCGCLVRERGHRRDVRGECGKLFDEEITLKVTLL